MSRLNVKNLFTRSVKLSMRQRQATTAVDRSFCCHAGRLISLASVPLRFVSKCRKCFCLKSNGACTEATNKMNEMRGRKGNQNNKFAPNNLLLFTLRFKLCSSCKNSLLTVGKQTLLELFVEGNSTIFVGCRTWLVYCVTIETTDGRESFALRFS